LRERKKRMMRGLISDTATEMFLERGFDEVRVTEVAAACGVSEKTVYNYFPTKESLLLDREEAMAEAIRQALGPGSPGQSPIRGALEILTRDLDQLAVHWDTPIPGGNGTTAPPFRRFAELIESTPSLRAAQRDMMDRLVRVAAEAMADRAGISPDDPEPQIAAVAILGLWRIQFAALRHHAEISAAAEDVFPRVKAEVERAATLIDSGLWSFEVMVQGAGTRDQVRAAAEAAQQAGRQVTTALRQARTVWRQMQQAARDGHDAAVIKHAQQEQWHKARRELQDMYLEKRKERQAELRRAQRGGPRRDRSPNPD
jgi:AcrR family transcriptional regulator